jgi:hypothetical protein
MEVILLILAAVGVSFILQKILCPVLNHLLNGPFNEYYLQYLNNNTRFQFDTAANELNPDRAWDEVIFKKVEELSSRGVPYSKREINLKYIKASGKVNKKLVDELIVALPHQQRNPEFQAKLTSYISELQGKLKEKGNGNGYNAIPPSINELVINTWTSAISIWLGGGLYFLLSMLFWDRYNVAFILLLNFGLFIAMLFPLLRLVWSKLTKTTSIVTLVTFLIVGMGMFAQQAHADKGRHTFDLTGYGFPNVKMTIDYPLWVNLDHLEKCGNENTLTVTLDGLIQDPLQLDFESSVMMTKGNNCQEVPPRFNDIPQPYQIFSFFIAPREKDALNSQTVIITPKILKKSNNLEITSPPIVITMENWIWRLMANTGFQLGSIGATGFLFAIKFFLGMRQ